MLGITLIIFLLTASAGGFLLSYVLRDKETPKGVAILHGSLGALGIILLAINAYIHPWFLVFFILVALGGAYLIFMDLSGKKVPKTIAIVHGSLALLGIIALVLTIMEIGARV